MCVFIFFFIIYFVNNKFLINNDYEIAKRSTKESDFVAMNYAIKIIFCDVKIECYCNETIFDECNFHLACHQKFWYKQSLWRYIPCLLQ